MTVNFDILNILKWLGAAAASIVSIIALCTLYWASDLPRFATLSELRELEIAQATSEIDYRYNRNHWDNIRLSELNKRIKANPEDREYVRLRDDLEERIKNNHDLLSKAKKRLER